MQYPGTSPAGFGFGRGANPQDLEQRKQALMQQMAGSGGQGPGTLSFGGSTGDAQARQPALSWNPFLAAQSAMYGIDNAGQQSNPDVSAQPFFGQQGQQGGNGAQAAQVTAQPALGDATQQQQAGITNPGFNAQTPGGAGRLTFGAGGVNPFGPFASTIQQLASYLGSNPSFTAPTAPSGGIMRYA